jgi:hypothetical protein
MALDERLAAECADWIAEQLNEELGGFVPAELVDMVMEHEATIRTDEDDPEMDHGAMSERLIRRLEQEGVPISAEGVSRELVEEIMRWEDEFLGLAGRARQVRP